MSSASFTGEDSFAGHVCVCDCIGMPKLTHSELKPSNMCVCGSVHVGQSCDITQPLFCRPSVLVHMCDFTHS